MKRAPVTGRALVQRINRKLKKSGATLRACLPTNAAFAELGDYYVSDDSKGVITHKNVDLEAYARELGALKAHETVKG